MRTRVLAVGALNAVLLAVAFGVFIAVSSGRGFDSFVLSGASGRMQGIAREIETRLRGVPESDAAGVVDDVSARFGIPLVLTENNGHVIGGAVWEIPSDVAAALEPGPPPPGAVRRPPPGTPVFLARSSTRPKYWAGVRMPIETSDRPGPRRGTLFFLSDGLYTNHFFFDPRPLLSFAAVALLISAACWWPFMRRMSRDIARAELVAGQRQFMRDTAHELRSPIARMQLGLDLIEAQAHAGAPAVRERVDRVRGDLRDMTALTDALLDAARVEAAAQSAPLEAIDVRQIVERAAAMERRPGVEFDVAGVPSLNAMGKSDALVRALANVLRNAVFYAGAGGPIAVRAARRNGHVDIVIEDGGPGVPDAALDQLFTPFYRVDASRTRASGGAGLGLAIARAAVEGSGGRISCRNRHPHGLEVTISLKAG